MDKRLGIDQPMSWHPPSWRGTSTQRGDCCYYCLQCYRARYQHTGVSFAELAVSMGKDASLHKAFITLRGSLIDTYVEAGGRVERVLTI